MIQVTLTTHSGDQQELRLPLIAEDVVRPYLGAFLAYGTASVEFEVPSRGLQELLKQSIPEKLDGGISELNIMANVLDHMNGQQLQRLEHSLGEKDCDFNEMMHRVFYYGCHAFSKNGKPDPNAKPLEEYDSQRDRAAIGGIVKSKLSKELESQRLTGGELFSKIIEQASENGDMEHFNAIAEYVLPENHVKGKLCRYEFDLLPAVNFGGSEGIYVDCSLRGIFDESGRNSIHIGTIKTLSEDLDACKVMGELCGVLLYHESKYVNEHLTCFDSLESIGRMLERPLNMEVNQELEVGMTQQML